MSKTLLIDCDFLFYKFAHRNEYLIEWDEETSSKYVDEVTALVEVDDFILGLCEKTECEEYILCISDDNLNFRYKVLPTYKHNRDDSQRPELWYILKAHLKENHPWLSMPKLEADDVLGILGSKDPDKYIISSLDKDLKTIPCWLFNWDKDVKPKWISHEEADRWFYLQTLMGDSTDGYSGCPGVGLVNAEKILNGLIKLVPYEHTFQRGPRKGQTETRYNQEEAESVWEAIVSWYESKGLTEEDALQQARVARILRHTDYDFKKKEPVLWTPSGE